jgi:hypothetical protein
LYIYELQALSRNARSALQVTFMHSCTNVG